MADLVNVRPEDLDKLSGAIKKYQEEIAQASKKMQNAINQAHWNDAQKDKFASKFRDTSKKCDQFIGNDCKEMTQHLRKLVEALKQYRSLAR